MLLNKIPHIRNVSIAGGPSHGKTTLVSRLQNELDIFSSNRFTPGYTTLREAEDKCTATESHLHGNSAQTIRSFAFNSRFNEEIPCNGAPNNEDRDSIMNVLDTPGHSDFAAELIAALTITDGVIVVVDVMQGVCLHTEAVIRRVLENGKMPIIVINKIDCLLTDSKMSNESVYNILKHVVESVSNVTSGHSFSVNSEAQVNPRNGTVIFASLLHDWAFTINHFALLYSKRLNIGKEQWREYLWGDHYFGPGNGWVRKPGRENPQERGFNYFILDPIRRFSSVTMMLEPSNIINEAWKNLDIMLPTSPELEAESATKIKKQELSATQLLIKTITSHIPTPVEAGRHLLEKFYNGPLDDEVAKSICCCDQQSPMVFYASKMLTRPDHNGFYALGRVLSGTLRCGQQVQVWGVDHDNGSNSYVKTGIATIDEIVTSPSERTNSLEKACAGNIVCVSGVDQLLHKAGILTTTTSKPNIRVGLRCPPPVIFCNVDVQNSVDLPKLVDGLKRLSKWDLAVRTICGDNGNHTVASPGEHHLNVCLTYLKIAAAVPLNISAHQIQYRESVRRKSSEPARGLSPNKRVHIFMTAEPFRNVKSPDSATLAQLPNLWAFGPADGRVNCLLNETKAVQYVDTLKESISAGFRWAVREGPLAEEPIHSVRFNLVDVSLQCDALFRGSGQIMPAVRRAMHASVLLGNPALMEPINVVFVHACNTVVSVIMSSLKESNGRILSHQQHYCRASWFTVGAHLPAINVAAFQSKMDSVADDRVIFDSVFNHWEIVQEEAPSVPGMLIEMIRKRKGLTPNMSVFKS